MEKVHSGLPSKIQRLLNLQACTHNAIALEQLRFCIAIVRHPTGVPWSLMLKQMQPVNSKSQEKGFECFLRMKNRLAYTEHASFARVKNVSASSKYQHDNYV